MVDVAVNAVDADACSEVMPVVELTDVAVVKQIVLAVNDNLHGVFGLLEEILEESAGVVLRIGGEPFWQDSEK